MDPENSIWKLEVHYRRRMKLEEAGENYIMRSSII
jgi:hypothetical protein